MAGMNAKAKLLASASVSLDFMTPGVLDPRITFTRASTATYFDSAGVMQTAASNSIRNSTMIGAVPGTPGTPPTNWAFGGSPAVTPQMVGTGTENGIPYIDMRFAGTTINSGVQILPEVGAGVMVAANGQAWSSSVYVQLVAGTLSGFNYIQLVTNETTAAGAQVKGNSGPVILATSIPTESLAKQRNVYSVTITGGGTVAAVQVRLMINTGVGVPIDFTLRIGAPQMEQGAAATQFIPTYGAANSAPRWDYDPATLQLLGLLIEEARTNIHPNSASFATWSKADVTVTDNIVVAPSGATAAANFVEGSAGSAIASSIPAPVAASSVVTYSMFVKRGNTDWLRMLGTDTGLTNGVNVWLNTTTGATSITTRGTATAPTVSVKVLPNGWWRLMATCTMPAASTAVGLSICSATADGSSTRVNGAQYNVWGGQIEVGASPTSHIPTGATAVTRAVDVCNVTPLGAWFNASAGTLLMDFDTSKAIATMGGFSSGSFANVLYYTTSGAAQVAANIASVGTTANQGGVVVNQQAKVAISYSTNRLAVSVNGLAPAVNATLPAGPYPWTSNMAIGTSPWSLTGANICGHARAWRYWSSALTDTEMQSVTS